jgi:hypothetical protein
MRLIVVLLTTICVVTISCLIIACKISFTEDESGMFLYAFVMIAGNIIGPVLFTTFLYSWLKRYIHSVTRVLTYCKQLILIALIFTTGTILMTSFKVISYYSGFSCFTFNNLNKEFDSSYRGYVPLLILATFLIPLIYLLFERKITKIAARLNIK